MSRLHERILSVHRRRSDSCFNCKGPGGEDVSGGYYEAGGSFLKLGIVESFLVRRFCSPVTARATAARLRCFGELSRADLGSAPELGCQCLPGLAAAMTAIPVESFLVRRLHFQFAAHTSALSSGRSSQSYLP